MMARRSGLIARVPRSASTELKQNRANSSVPLPPPSLPLLLALALPPLLSSPPPLSPPPSPTANTSTERPVITAISAHSETHRSFVSCLLQPKSYGGLYWNPIALVG